MSKLPLLPCFLSAYCKLFTASLVIFPRERVSTAEDVTAQLRQGRGFFFSVDDGATLSEELKATEKRGDTGAAGMSRFADRHAVAVVEGRPAVTRELFSPGCPRDLPDTYFPPIERNEQPA